MGGDDNGSVLRDITTSLLGTFFDDETTEATQIDVFAISERPFAVCNLILAVCTH